MNEEKMKNINLSEINESDKQYISSKEFWELSNKSGFYLFAIVKGKNEPIAFYNGKFIYIKEFTTKK